MAAGAFWLGPLQGARLLPSCFPQVKPFAQGLEDKGGAAEA